MSRRNSSLKLLILAIQACLAVGCGPTAIDRPFADQQYLTARMILEKEEEDLKKLVQDHQQEYDRILGKYVVDQTGIHLYEAQKAEDVISESKWMTACGYKEGETDIESKVRFESEWRKTQNQEEIARLQRYADSLERFTDSHGTLDELSVQLGLDPRMKPESSEMKTIHDLLVKISTAGSKESQQLDALLHSGISCQAYKAQLQRIAKAKERLASADGDTQQ